MSQKSTRTRELCQSYLGFLETAGIDPVIITAYRCLIKSQHGLYLTASALHADTQTLTAELAAEKTKVRALLDEIQAMHEDNAGETL